MSHSADLLSDRRSAIHLLRSGRTPVEVAQEVARSVSWVYKWRNRFQAHQEWAALQDRSRRPSHQPRQLTAAVRQAICQVRSQLEAEAAEPGALTSAQRRAYGRAYLAATIEHLQARCDERAADLFGRAVAVCPELLLQLNTFYELACGSQLKGYRGDFASLDKFSIETADS